MALSKVDLANQVENQLPQSLVADNVNFRNILINGDMSIAQRATSTSSITGTDATCDRWRFAASSAGTWTISQSTTVPTGQGFATSFKADCTTANTSLSAGSILRLSQFIEGQNLQYLKKGTSSAESLTMSFWVRSAKTGTYIINLKDRDNTRVISKSYTINSADTWEKKTITCDGDTTGAFDNDNDWSLEVHFYLVAGSTYSSGTLNTSWNSQTTADIAVGQVNLADSTSNDWYVTGVQLEAGTAASDFEHLPYDTNLTKCMRYLQVVRNNDSGGYYTSGLTISGGTTCNFFIPLKVIPRTYFTGITVQNASGFGGTTLSVAKAATSITFGNTSHQGVLVQLVTSGTFTANEFCYMINSNNAIDARVFFTGAEFF